MEGIRIFQFDCIVSAASFPKKDDLRCEGNNIYGNTSENCVFLPRNLNILKLIIHLRFQPERDELENKSNWLNSSVGEKRFGEKI